MRSIAGAQAVCLHQPTDPRRWRHRRRRIGAARARERLPKVRAPARRAGESAARRAGCQGLRQTRRHTRGRRRGTPPAVCARPWPNPAAGRWRSHQRAGCVSGRDVMRPRPRRAARQAYVRGQNATRTSGGHVRRARRSRRVGQQHGDGGGNSRAGPTPDASFTAPLLRHPGSVSIPFRRDDGDTVRQCSHDRCPARRDAVGERLHDEVAGAERGGCIRPGEHPGRQTRSPSAGSARANAALNASPPRPMHTTRAAGHRIREWTARCASARVRRDHRTCRSDRR